MGNTDSTPQHGGDGDSVVTATTTDPAGDGASAFPVNANTKKRNNAVTAATTATVEESESGVPAVASAPPADPVATAPVASAPPADPVASAPVATAPPLAPVASAPPAEPEGDAGTNEANGNGEGATDSNGEGATDGNAEPDNDTKKKQECAELLKPSPDIQKIEEAPGFFSWLGNWFSYDYWQDTEEEKKKRECETILGTETTDTNTGTEGVEAGVPAEGNAEEAHGETIVREGGDAPPPKEDLLGTQGGGRRHTHKNRTSRRKTHKNRE